MFVIFVQHNNNPIIKTKCILLFLLIDEPSQLSCLTSDKTPIKYRFIELNFIDIIPVKLRKW